MTHWGKYFGCCPDVNPWCKADAQDLDKIVESEEEETLGSSESSSDDLTSSVNVPLLRDPKEKHQFHLNATLEVGKSLKQQVQFDIKDFDCPAPVDSD
ncbi:hypothetical protein H4Q26_006312 [Puccinia striiformis f. sp. tritici PST-130]|nr:hypothetical protein H4Q26_006312 [Puccinia striiformis f. sp. tritici PST-130]